MNRDRSALGKFCLTVLTFALIGMTGCEWEGSGDGDFWSERHSFINFSGIYRPARGSSIILSYEGSGAVDSSTGIGVISSETLGSGDGVSTTYGGTLQETPVLPGSLSITAGGFHLTDSGNGELEAANATGDINYGTGAWDIDLGGVPLNNGATITASYRYEGPLGGGSDKPGSTYPIYQFTVQQTGNQVTLIDNYGQSYQGKLAAVDTVSDSGMVGDQRQIDQRFSFVAEGVAHGMRIQIIGAFRAYQTVYYSRVRTFSETGQTAITEQLEELYTIASYFLEGTWIEPDGKTGSIEAMGPANQRIEIVNY